MVIKGERIGLYLSGMPIQVVDCNIAITQPTIKDVVVFGEDEFLIDANLIGKIEDTVKKVKEGNSQLEFLSDFQVLLVMLREEKTIKDSIIRFFDLIFPNYKIEMTDSSFEFYVVQEEQELLVGRINSFNFEDFRIAINDLFIPQIANESEPDYNPANDAAAAIAEKIKKGRAKKQELNAEKEGAQSLFGRYTSILAIGMQMDVHIFYNYTPFQLYDAFNRYFSKVSSDFYTKVSTTPLMDVSKMEAPPD